MREKGHVSDPWATQRPNGGVVPAFRLIVGRRFWFPRGLVWVGWFRVWRWVVVVSVVHGGSVGGIIVAV